MSEAEPLSGLDIARAREIFGIVCDLPPHERDAKLLELCAGKPHLLSTVRDLLLAHDSPQAILDSQHGEISRQLFREADSAVDSIGQYKIRAIIGKGGMGIVYLAEQSNPHREVALKIVRRGWNSDSLQSRFEREIRVLGRLQHPGITHIYEAGTADTKDGPVAFFAMEYVNGRPLTEAVSEMNLPLTDRIELLAKIADAVQHAHTKGVIHRDLKPANILVIDTAAESTGGDSSIRSRAGGPQPKILDFGVARVLEPDTVHTQVTEAGHVIGTISYMSPEQLSGDIDSVDARTDVYALGVILYELISGRLPHELRSKPIAEAARIVRDDRPAPLNSKGSPRCDRDLETIVLHAIEKDRERRYATAAALAEDLRRYLRNETILARPATTFDQFSKLARRNKGLVLGLTAAAVAISSGLVISTVLYLKEQKARERADAKERLNAAFKEYMIDGVLLAARPDRKGWEVKVMDVLTEASQGLHGKFPDDPEIEAALHIDLGSVLGNVGKLNESKAEYLAALPLVEKIHGPLSVEAIHTLNAIAGAHQLTQENAQWLQFGQDALQRAEATLPLDHFDRLVAMNNVGGALITLGKIDEGREILNRARAPAEKDPQANREPLANIYNWLTVCETAANNLEAALAMRYTNLDFMIKYYGPNHRDTLAARTNLVVALMNASDREGSIKLLRGLPEAIEREFPPGHPIRSHIYAVAGTTLCVPGHFEESENYLLKAYELQVSLAKDFDWFTELRIRFLNQLYARWPGHQEQAKYWSAHAVKARLMLAGVDELKNFPDVLTVAVRVCQEAGLTVTRPEMIQYIWEHRDEFAPAGHGRRGAFFANFVRMALPEGQTEHIQESMALAQESVATEGGPDNAKNLIAAAQSMLSAPPAPPSK